MTELAWQTIVRLVHERAEFCCEYCQTCQRVIGQSMHIDHIIPGESNDLENLALACPSCNQSKAKATQAIDPDTGHLVSLFHPRQQIWAEHFAWIENGERLLGLTDVGRATIKRLKMNQERIIVSRRLWIESGLHPPT